MNQDIELNRRNRLINHIKNIEQDEDKLIYLVNERDHYTYFDWDYVTENINIPLIIANNFILKREEVEKEENKRTGIDFLILLYNQNYPEDFYKQEYIKELLNMDEDDYSEIMGQYNRLICGNKLWYDLFYCNQWFFSERFILDNIEDITTNFTKDEYSYQRYQKVPVELYEKYIDKLTHINFHDQVIPIWFIKKYIRKYPNIIDVSSIYHTENLKEETFIELLSYPEISDKKYQDVLWLTVGSYNVSETFIRDNLEHINKIYSNDNWITNGYKSPWVLILQNSIDYSETLFEENIDNLKLIKSIHSIFTMNEFSSKFIYKFLNEKYGSTMSSNKDYNNDIMNILDQKSIEYMDDFVEELLNNNIIIFKNINKSNFILLNIIEKYHNKVGFTHICYYNRNITLDFFINKILKWQPNLKLDINTYLHIEKYSEKTIKYFIENYHILYNKEEIDLFYELLNDLMEDDNKYSNELVTYLNNHINNTKIKIKIKIKKEDDNTLNYSKVSSFNDPKLLYEHSLYSLQQI